MDEIKLEVCVQEALGMGEWEVGVGGGWQEGGDALQRGLFNSTSNVLVI